MKPLFAGMSILVLSAGTALAEGAAASRTNTAALNLTSASSAMPLPKPRPYYVASTIGSAPTATAIAEADPAYLPAYSGDAGPVYATPIIDGTLSYDPVPLDTLPMTTVAAPIYAEPLEDNRIRDIVYDPSQVTEIDGYMGYVTTISFGERVTAITMGDPSAWDVKPLGAKRIVSIKPVKPDSNTNMVVTGASGRIYTFQLKSHEASYGIQAERIPFRISFNPPVRGDQRGASFGGPGLVPASVQSVDATDLNFDYTYRGGDQLRPIRAFDDGSHTYFQFPRNTRAPAIFTVDSEGREALVNYTVKGAYFVVQGTARQFTLRDGSDFTCIYNKSFEGPTGHDGGSPLIEGSQKGLAV